MTSVPTEIAVYDLDRTLTDTGSWMHYLRFWLRHEAPGNRWLWPIVVVAGIAYLLRLISRGELKRVAHGQLLGWELPVEQVSRVSEAFARGFVAAHALPSALAALAEDRAAGRRIVIASASFGYYVRHIARELGVADVVATELVETPGCRSTDPTIWAKLAGPNCYGAAKRQAVETWLAAQGLDDAVVHFTSDHHSDLPCFELALERGGQVRCANPSDKLAAIAKVRGWPVVQWGRIKGSLFERA